MSDGEQRRRLPIWRSVKAAYLALFRNPVLALKLVAIPYILGVIPGIYEALTIEDMAMGQPQAVEMSDGFGLLPFAVSILAALAIIPAITAWHRLVLLGHDDSDSRLRYSIQRTEWVYLLKLVLFYLIVILLAVLMSFATFASFAALGSMPVKPHWSATIGLIILIGLGWALYVGLHLRLSLVFPAAAIGETFSFRESWRASEHNTWRLIFSFLLAMLPMIAVSLPLGFVFYRALLASVSGGGADFALPIFVVLLMTLIQVPLGILSLCVMTSIWSWSYRYLVQGEDIVLPGERTA